jgi:hypothetical protein
VRAFVLSSVHQKLFVLSQRKKSVPISGPSQITNHKFATATHKRKEIWECSTLHSLALCRPQTALVLCRRPPPPLVASRRVVPCPRLSRLRCRSEGTVASPHPSQSRRRRGKTPSTVVVLRSDDDASRRPPPPL